MPLSIHATSDASGARAGRAVFLAAICVCLALALPVLWRGAPLADDFINCLAPQDLGLGGYIASSWSRLGAVRLARFPEIVLTTAVCQTMPFGVAIAVPLLLTLAVALLARAVLRDLGASTFWSNVAGAAWLLQPLGTEASLWPAALHVPLGLAFALIALRLCARGRLGWAALAGVGAATSVEQTILALPLAVWLVTPPSRRRSAVLYMGLVALIALGSFALFPGRDIRLRVGLVERLAALVSDPLFYVTFPAVGLGLHSIPLAVRWAFPWSVAALAAGAALGAFVGRGLPVGEGLSKREAGLRIAMAVALVVLANVPVMLNLPHQGSPRIFTPTWLILVMAGSEAASRVTWRRPIALGVAGGALASAVVLSLALSVSVRLASADFAERASHAIASRVPDGSTVAVCGVRRTVRPLAPRGAFAVHELLYEWTAQSALAYYTGRRATFLLAGEPWDRSCPDARTVDAVLSFDELARAVQP